MDQDMKQTILLHMEPNTSNMVLATTPPNTVAMKATTKEGMEAAATVMVATVEAIETARDFLNAAALLSFFFFV